MTNYHWPQNTRELQSVVRSAVSRTNTVDTQHLPAELLTNGTRRQLSRLQTLERDEIIRCLMEPATTVAQAADRLGMSRATIYRKMTQYRIKIAGRTPRGIT